MLAALPRNPRTAVPSSSSLGPDVRRAIPADATVRAFPDSWQPDGFGGGVITAKMTVPGSKPTVYAVIVLHERDGWKVAATLPVQDGAP